LRSCKIYRSILSINQPINKQYWSRVRSRRWLAAAADFFENNLAAAAAEQFNFLAAAAEENDG